MHPANFLFIGQSAFRSENC